MKRATLEELKAATWKVRDDSFLKATPRPSTPTPSGTLWVNILNRWFVMSRDVRTVGEFLTVTKRDGSTQEVLIDEIVGTFEDKVIYRVTKEATV